MERQLGEKRKAELEKTVVELESRQGVLKRKMDLQKKSIRRFLMALKASGEISDREVSPQEKLEAPRRKVLANLVDHSLKEVEAMKADLQDAAQLEMRIQEEKQQLAYLFQDLREQEGVLELNRQLQLDLIKRKRQERVFQLENYRKLKTAEAQVERLITDFNARMELKKVEEAERIVSRSMRRGDFFKMKGRLPSPVFGGKVISRFGRVFDPRSGLNIFKKGIDIRVPGRQPVRAISAGKIAFSGTMPNYGNVVIVDHGEHFYSLCAHLGEIRKKTHESVAAQEQIGLTDDSAPLYFEIRARNVAVNPLQWLFN
jgi:septal ring factor EnvC (AmiA/AmiB activator)